MEASKCGATSAASISRLEIALLVVAPSRPRPSSAYLDGAAGPAGRHEQGNTRRRACAVAAAAGRLGGLLHGLY